MSEPATYPHPLPGVLPLPRTPKAACVPVPRVPVDLLERVLAGLKNLPGADFELVAVPTFTPVPSCEDRFAADLRHKGGLPLFRKTARAHGWAGLDESFSPAAPSLVDPGQWDQAQTAVGVDFYIARQQVLGQNGDAK